MEEAALAVRFVLASVLLVAGAAKAPRLAEFEDAVRRYELVPARAVGAVSVAVPAFELVAGSLLAVGFAIRAVAAMTAVVFCVFACVVAVNLVRGRAIDCGCFTPTARRRITQGTVVSNLVLAAFAVLLAVVSPTSLAVDGISTSEPATVAAEDAGAIAFASTLALVAAAIASHALRIVAALRGLPPATRRPR